MGGVTGAEVVEVGEAVGHGGEVDEVVGGGVVRADRGGSEDGRVVGRGHF